MARAARAGWTEVYVGPRCTLQTNSDRFGTGADKAIKLALEKFPNHDGIADEMWIDEEEDMSDDSDSDDGEAQEVGGDTPAPLNLYDSSDEALSDASSEAPDFPEVARMRMNLTVLSQHYDLYFVAYRNQIYVYRPHAGPEILKHQPELVLQPPVSSAGRRISGHIDGQKPHQVNHLIVGDLGDSEILLMCYDDGDVVAYYTHLIAKYIQSNPRRPSFVPRSIKPFFHESVGVSAWGLAVHKQSRLIAVSSNYHEVTVFAFALTPARRQMSRRRAEADTSPMTCANMTAVKLEEHLRCRDRTWKIVLPLNELGTNLPNVSFWDDEKGDAEKVAAVDIAGTCWLLDIWKVGNNPVHIPVPTASPTFRGRGWGIVVLPMSLFLPTETLSEALGGPTSNCTVEPRTGGGQCVDISGAQRPRPPPPPQAGVLPMPGGARGPVVAETLADIINTREGNDEDSDGGGGGGDGDGDGDGEIAESLAQRWRAIPPPHNPDGPESGYIDLRMEEDQLGYRRPLAICPNLGTTGRPETIYQRAHTEYRRSKTVVHGLTVARDVGSIPSTARLAILRTFEVSVELLTTNPGDASVICHKLLEMPDVRSLARPFGWDMPFGQRMSMLHVIPELGVVLIGSMWGRVAILRLTRPPQSPPNRKARVRRAFRVEWVLPRAEEEHRGLRPRYCLLGMAVSREPEPGALGLRLSRAATGSGNDGSARDTAVYPKRWRLVLHYTEHTLLRYTLELTETAGELALQPI